MEQCGNLIVFNDFGEKGARDIIALQGLFLVSSSEDVPTFVQPAILDSSESWRVLVIAESEA